MFRVTHEREVRVQDQREVTFGLQGGVSLRSF
jgi:hypothetical protein